MDDQFRSRSRDERSGETAEGVRIIGAEEAAEALERGDVAQRRGSNVPRYGDRPSPPPEGPRPALRFPLGGTSDPTELERPPIVPPPASSRPRPGSGVSEPPEVSGRPEVPRRPLVAGRAPDIDLTAAEERPPSERTPSGEVPLPHWTEPATGEVPRILAADDDFDDDLDEDLEAWSSLSGGGPRWRDTSNEWEESDYDDVAELGDDETRIGALDTSDRPAPNDYYDFDELEPGGEPAYQPAPEPRPRSIRTGPRRSGTSPTGAGGDSTGSGGLGPGRDLPVAIAVGVGIAVLALILFSIGPGAAMVLVTPVVVLAAAEWFSALRRAGHQPATLLGLAAVTSLVLAAFWRGEAAYPLVLALTVVFGLLWHLWGVVKDRPAMNLGVTFLGVLYVGLLGSFAALMLTLPDGIGVLLAAVIATVAYDVGGYVIGRNAGRSPLTAASPSKTVEGLIGGMVVTVVVTVLVVGAVPGIHPFDDFGDALWLGVVAALAAPLGDLCESMLKRDLEVKDMGTILPGHGGLLDRFDALLFVLPAAYYLVRLLEIY